MEKETLTVTLSAEKDNLRATLAGEVDHHNAKGAREAIDKALFKHRPKRLVLDLSGVGFMDSSGLGLILGRVALCEELGAEVQLESPSLRVRKVLAVAGIDRLQNLSINS